MASQEGERQSKARPQSTIARNFSQTLDEMFKLDGVGALELSLEQKKDDLSNQKFALTSLDHQLRETEERLQKLEAKHRRRSQMLGAQAQRSHLEGMFKQGVREEEEEDPSAKDNRWSNSGSEDSGGTSGMSDGEMERRG